jgi:hypothetical protein
MKFRYAPIASSTQVSCPAHHNILHPEVLIVMQKIIIKEVPQLGTIPFPLDPNIFLGHSYVCKGRNVWQLQGLDKTMDTLQILYTFLYLYDVGPNFAFSTAALLLVLDRTSFEQSLAEFYSS